MPRPPERIRLGDLLIQQNLLTSEQLTLALAEQKRTGRKLGRIFVESGYVTEDGIAKALVRRFKADFTYECKGRKPSLSYAVTYTVLDRYEYDFENLRWRYLSWARKKYFASPEDPAPKPFPDSTEAAEEDPVPPANGQAGRHRR